MPEKRCRGIKAIGCQADVHEFEEALQATAAVYLFSQTACLLSKSGSLIEDKAGTDLEPMWRAIGIDNDV